MDFIRNTSEKMKLWRVEHFFPPFFSRSVLIGGKFIFTKKSITRFAFQCNFNQWALIWKKTGGKSVQLVRGSFFWKYFLWNPYFNTLLLVVSFFATQTLLSHVRTSNLVKSNALSDRMSVGILLWFRSHLLMPTGSISWYLSADVIS